LAALFDITYGGFVGSWKKNHGKPSDGGLREKRKPESTSLIAFPAAPETIARGDDCWNSIEVVRVK